MLGRQLSVWGCWGGLRPQQEAGGEGRELGRGWNGRVGVVVWGHSVFAAGRGLVLLGGAV